MIGMYTRVSSTSRLKIGFKAVDAQGSHKNGKHLLGPIPGSEDDESYDLEEEAMRMDGLTEMERKSSAPSNFKMERGEDEYTTPLQGYDLDMNNDADEHPSASPSATRHFRGEDGYQTYVREQLGSTSKSTDMLSEIESRLSDTIPIKKMVTPIESTRQVLPQRFGIGGQTGPLQAQSEVERSINEKESHNYRVFGARPFVRV